MEDIHGIKKISVILAFATFLFFSTSSVFAQDSSGVKVQPSLVEERVEPGETFSGTLHVKNLSDQEQIFFLSKRNIEDVSPDGKPVFAVEQDDTGLEIASWIVLAKDSITVPVGEEDYVTYDIIVPENAPPGGYFGGIFLSVRPEETRETGATIGFEVGTIVSLQVAGDIVDEAYIREFSSEKTLYSAPVVSFKTVVSNQGNILSRPRGTLEIIDMFGKKISTLRVNEDAGGIIPKKDRQFMTTWEGDGFYFGRYTAIVSLVYGQDVKKTISDTITFWILPINILMPILVAILISVIVLYVTVKMHINRRLRAMRQAAGVSGARSAKRGVVAQPPISRLAISAIVLLSFTILFLMFLFFFFA